MKPFVILSAAKDLRSNQNRFVIPTGAKRSGGTCIYFLHHKSGCPTLAFEMWGTPAAPFFS